jgi:hypothetical protein
MRKATYSFDYNCIAKRQKKFQLTQLIVQSSVASGSTKSSRSIGFVSGLPDIAQKCATRYLVRKIPVAGRRRPGTIEPAIRGRRKISQILNSRPWFSLLLRLGTRKLLLFLDLRSHLLRLFIYFQEETKHDGGRKKIERMGTRLVRR